MFKLFFIYFLCINIILIQPFCINIFADTNYARAENTIYLYKSATNSDDTSNIHCIIEKGYFVEITESISNYFSVNYNGINGFVKKNDVEEIINTPQTPYPDNIKLIIGSDCNLRSSPTIKSESNNIIATLKSGESNLSFIGRIYSEEAIDFGGTTWYLVKYQNNYGYIYNKYVKSITPIIENTEEVSYKSKLNSDISNPITNTPSLIIVIILFLPCLFILFILYYPKKQNRKTKQTKKQDKY